MEYLNFVLCLLLAWTVIHFFLSTKVCNKSNPKRLPTGPPTLPILGNLLSLGNNPHISLSKLAKTYGPLMLLHLSQVPTVVISSAHNAKEALQKNDIALSSRHTVDGAHAHNHHESSVAWLPVSATWRNFRKICNSQVFSAHKLDASQNLRRKKVEDLLKFVQKQSESGIAVDIGQEIFSITLNLLSMLEY